MKYTVCYLLSKPLGEKSELDTNQSVSCRSLDPIHKICEGVKQSIQLACLRCPNSKEIS